MPDQSSAATEHSIIQEITRPLDSLPDDPLEIVNADFPTALRGYDRMAVDDFVRQTRQLVAELQATRSPEAAVRRALERVGEQIGGILKRAHETAEQITAQSRSEAEDRLQQARLEARQLIDSAEQRVRDLDADTDRIWLERQRIVADAEDLAAQLHAVARTAAERFPEDEEAGPGDRLEDEGEAEAAEGEAEAAGGASGEVEPAGIIGPDAELAQPETLAADEDPAPGVPFDGETTAETAQHPIYGVRPDDEADFFSGEAPPPPPARSEVEQTMAFRPLSEDSWEPEAPVAEPGADPSAGTPPGEPDPPFGGPPGEPDPSFGTSPGEPDQPPDARPPLDPDATQVIRPSSEAAHRRHDG
jgi:DivIVA domain-containing protein